MFDEPFSLFDEVLDLHSRWLAISEEMRGHAARLLDRGWAFGSDVAGADLGALSDLTIHAAQVIALQNILTDLGVVLEEAEERRVGRIENHWGLAAVPSLDESVGEARPSTREPSSEGCTQPESGQRKSE
jgi:hypothetical protein